MPLDFFSQHDWYVQERQATDKGNAREKLLIKCKISDCRQFIFLLAFSATQKAGLGWDGVVWISVMTQQATLRIFGSQIFVDFFIKSKLHMQISHLLEWCNFPNIDNSFAASTLLTLPLLNHQSAEELCSLEWLNLTLYSHLT